MTKNKLYAAALAAALCLTAAPVAAMTQKEFIDLCRTGSASEVALALSDAKLSAAANVGGVSRSYAPMDAVTAVINPSSSLIFS